MYINEVKISYHPRYKISDLKKITSSSDAHKLLREIWNQDLSYRETFYLVLLNRNNKAIGVKEFEGGTSSCLVDIKICLQIAILGNAQGVLVAHNHPSGNLKPSGQDNKLTNDLQKAFSAVQISLLDHIIIDPENGYYSYMDEGLL